MNHFFNERIVFNTIEEEGHLAQIEEILKGGGVSLVFIETPTNPLLKVFDIRGIVELVSKHKNEKGLPRLVVDSTFCTPLYQNPVALGADAALHSATKFLSGHSDCCAGVICTNDKDLHSSLTHARSMAGNHLGESPSQLLFEGLQTLKLRVSAQKKNAIAVAEYLRSHSKI